MVESAAKPPNAGKGRVKGVPNKTTALLKDAILKAATAAGDGDMAVYLEQQAKANPGPFMALLGKVLPMQVNAEVEGGITIKVVSGVPRASD
jgi:hypothetical protein